jgi:hypothetical protein
MQEQIQQNTPIPEPMLEQESSSDHTTDKISPVEVTLVAFGPKGILLNDSKDKKVHGFLNGQMDNVLTKDFHLLFMQSLTSDQRLYPQSSIFQCLN